MKQALSKGEFAQDELRFIPDLLVSLLIRSPKRGRSGPSEEAPECAKLRQLRC